MTGYVTARDIAAFERVPLATVYRWASTDRWRRLPGRPVRYHVQDVATTRIRHAERGLTHA